MSGDTEAIVKNQNPKTAKKDLQTNNTQLSLYYQNIEKDQIDFFNQRLDCASKSGKGKIEIPFKSEKLNEIIQLLQFFKNILY